MDVHEFLVEEFLNDSDSEESSDEDDVDEVDIEHGDGGRSYPRIDWRWWLNLGDPHFNEHFRMDRRTFQALLFVVGNHMVATRRLERQGTPVYKSLMMTLWILATPDSFRSTGVKFGKPKGTVHHHYKMMIAVLRELRGRYLRWPEGNEMHEIVQWFEHLFGYPGVLGCIDGCHVRITAPLEQPERYFNYHHEYSIHVQGVCDHHMIFRDALVGNPGAVGDRRVFQRSYLSKVMLSRQEAMGDYHLLGDGAYPLTNNLMIPYRNFGNLDRRQATHNYTLSRTRSTIERAFALLKGKWRRLKYFPSDCLEYANDHIMACIVLHNFIILEGVAYEGDAGIDYDHDADFDHLLLQAAERGNAKREYIADMLYED